MHSNKALTSMLFQFAKMTRSVMLAITCKPDDQAEWINILQLMYHFRQTLACSMCGKIVSDPYSPVQEPCHGICSTCRSSTHLIKYTCLTCRNAFQDASGHGFKQNSELKNFSNLFEQLCKLLADKQVELKWSNLQVSTQNGPVTFGQLIQEGCSSVSSLDSQNLADKFRKKIKEKEHYCRCGSGSKKNDGRPSGNLTCLGQRCACYQKSKGCVNCKCVGCKNPHGTSSS